MSLYLKMEFNGIHFYYSFYPFINYFGTQRCKAIVYVIKKVALLANLWLNNIWMQKWNAYLGVFKQSIFILSFQQPQLICGISRPVADKFTRIITVFKHVLYTTHSKDPLTIADNEWRIGSDSRSITHKNSFLSFHIQSIPNAWILVVWSVCIFI